jgi:hypothetical protein
VLNSPAAAVAASATVVLECDIVVICVGICDGAVKALVSVGRLDSRGEKGFVRAKNVGRDRVVPGRDKLCSARLPLTSNMSAELLSLPQHNELLTMMSGTNLE